MKAIFSFVLFLFSPVLGFISSYRYFKSRLGQLMFVLFFVAVNYCLKFREQDDLYRYVEIYNTLLRSDYMGGYGFFIETLYSWLAKNKVSAIYLYTIIALIFANGMYLCLKMVLTYMQRNRFCVLILVACIFYITPADFSVFRFYSASFYFVYFVWCVEVGMHPKWNKLGLVLPVLIHPIYLFILIGYVVYKWKKPNVKTLIKLAVFTLIFHFVNIRGFLRTSGYEYFGETRYLTEERNEDLTGTFSIGQQFFVPMLLILVYAIYIQYKRYYTLDNTNKKLLCLALFSICMMNFSANAADLYLRYIKVNFWFCTLPVLYYYMQHKIKEYGKLSTWIPVAIFFLSYDFIFVTAFDFYDFGRLFTNTFPSMFDTTRQILDRI